MGTRNSVLKGPGDELGYQLISSGHSGRRVLWRSQGQLPSLERTVGSVWGQCPGNQPRRGVPHNLATARLTQPVSSDLKYSSSGKQRVPYLHRQSVRATEEAELGSAAPDSPLSRTYPLRPRLLRISGSWKRLQAPTLTSAAGLQPNGTHSRHFRSGPPSSPPPKEKCSTFLEATREGPRGISARLSQFGSCECDKRKDL